MLIDTQKVDYAVLPAPSSQREARALIQLSSLSNPSVPLYSLNQTGRPEHERSAILFSVEIKTSVSVDDPLLQLAIWASAGLQAVSNVFHGDLAPERVPPAFMMSMKGAQCQIANMNLASGAREGGLPTR